MQIHALPAKATGEGVVLCNRLAFALIFGKYTKRLRVIKTILRVMKLTAILLTVCSITVTARSVSQSITFSGKQVELEKVFNVIKAQTGYFVMCDKGLLAHAKPVTIEAKNMPLNDFLKNVLKDQPLTYSFINTTIAIEGKEVNEKVNTVVVFFQPPITGTVRDADGNALGGINVTIKGKSTGVITDAEGNFKINAAAGDVLVFSSVEYDSYEYKISTKEEVKGIGIELSRKISSLHAVEVNKGYYTVKDELNTGNVFTVKGEELRKQPVGDPMLALEGRVPGLMISQTAGVPGSPLNIQLRGKNFINTNNIAANDPLYIVDGLPFSSQSFLARNISSIINPAGNPTAGLSSFNLINTTDIESIQVLKDADATAIYGSRGANGVIIITTRKGKPGKSKVDINLFQGYSKQTIMAKLLNTHQYLEMMHEAYRNDGLVFPSITTNPYDYNYDINGVWDTARNNDWSNELMGKFADFTNLQAGISGGNIYTRFLINGGYIKQGTYFPGNYADQKASLHFDISHNSVDQRFHISLSGNYANNNNNIPGGPSLGSINQYAPDAPAIYDAKGNINWQTYQGSATWSNPLANIHEYSKTLSNNLSANLLLSYQLLKNLNLKTNFSYQTVQSTQQNIRPSTVNPPPYNADPSSRQLNFSTTNNQTWNNETQLIYNLKIGKGNLEALAGTTIQSSKGNSVAYNTSGYSSDVLITNVRSASTYTLNYTSSPEYHFASTYARIGYNWNEKYMINLTGRRDGSSRFGPGRQFGNFGAVGAGWIFSKENYIQQSIPWLSYGKVRASYGITGSDGIGDFKFLSTYSPFYPGTYLGVTSLNPTGVTDPFYRWQQNKKLDASIELGFAKDRINTQITYYQNRSDNQLVSYLLSRITGFPGVTTNLSALVQNTGWEVVLNTFNIRRKNFSWSTSFNISIPKNKLLSYPGLINSTIYSVGKSLYTKLLIHYIGVDPQTGIYSFSGKRGNGSPAYYPQDYTWSKPITQQYYGGINNMINYKGFSLDLFIQFVKQPGYSYQKAVFQFAPGYSMQNQPEAVMKRWQKPGDITSIQKFTTGYADYAPTLAYQQFVESDGTIVDASFIRLKSVNLSYQLPNSLKRGAHLQNARIYLQCQNMFTITKYQVLDPETQNLLAPVKTLTIGIQLTL